MSNLFNYHALLYLACILAGFALIKVAAVQFLASLATVLVIIGAIVVLIFVAALLYLGFKTLLHK
ncbi:hypothetical protein [Neobacillus dielmonensis]|uniref:hypothetical protein n=1 Tax=Neobacillus dielmonensis TaxID=1347369 RepID=UPI0005A6CF85|nr:hypothetical protein [Neobacillus dielmonensis]